jgi:hypothetical protein
MKNLSSSPSDATHSLEIIGIHTQVFQPLWNLTRIFPFIMSDYRILPTNLLHSSVGDVDVWRANLGLGTTRSDQLRTRLSLEEIIRADRNCLGDNRHRQGIYQALINSREDRTWQ